MVYAHYALMGGFAANVDNIHNVFEIVTLAADGIIFLTKHGYCCLLDPGEIEDKNKTGYLAKGLVSVHVVWIVGQSVERQIANIPILCLKYKQMCMWFAPLR